MAFQLSDTLNKDKVFLVRRSELEERLDCEYYNPSHYRDLALLGNSPYSSSKLKDVCVRIVDGPFGSAIKADDYVEDGIPFIRVADVTHGEGTIKKDNLIHISHKAHKEISRSKVVPGDVVIAKTGATMGAASVVPDYIPEANIRGDLAALTLLEEYCSAEYAITYINTPLGQRLFWRLDSGGTRGRVVIGNLIKYPVIIPPHDIQNKIVAKMDLARTTKKQKEAQSQQLLDTIDSYLLNELGVVLPPEEQNTISQRMFIRKFSGISGGRLDPTYYKMLSKYDGFQKLGNFVMIAGGKRIPAGMGYSDFPTGYKYLRVDNIDADGNVDWHDLKYISENIYNILKNYELNEDEVIVSIAGTIGKITKSICNNNIILTENCAKLICNKQLLLPDYLKCLLKSDIIQQQFKANCMQTTIPKLGLGRIMNLLIPSLPTPKKQREIADHIQSIRDQAKQLRTDASAGLEKAKQEVESMILGKPCQ